MKKKLKIQAIIDDSRNILGVQIKKKGFNRSDSILESMEVVGLLTFLRDQEMKKIEEALENG